VTLAISLKRLTGMLAIFGIAAKVALFECVAHTSNWSAGTRILTYVTVAVGLLTMLFAVIDFGRSWELERSWRRWAPLLAFALGLLTFAPVLGYAA
jgi:hypothetical protein